MYEEEIVMKIVRTSVALAAVFAAVSWSATSHAGDHHGDKDKDKDKTGATVGDRDHDTDTATGAADATDPTTDTAEMDATGPTDADATGTTETTGAGIDTWGTGDDATGTTGTTGTGTMGTEGGTMQGQTQPYPQTQPYQAQPYQAQPYGTTQTTSAQTTTTAATYDPMVGAERSRSVRPNRPMLITGGSIFLGTYAASAVQGAISNTDADRNNFIPVAGPWMNLSERQCNLGDCGTREDVHNLLIIGSGVAQAVGVGLSIASLFVPEERDRYEAKAKEKKVAKPQMTVTPVSLQGGGGLGAFGTF
jgi:hypothetical protein